MATFFRSVNNLFSNSATYLQAEVPYCQATLRERFERLAGRGGSRGGHISAHDGSLPGSGILDFGS